MGNVHCRTGSLETLDGVFGESFSVHCRTGSLENYHFFNLLR
ncbi:hypothetical protein plpl0045 (plasmid) [Legionella pneumophila str. Lens]|uniref:Uncharacterized protein n=1 Tax=Legionella pneumophila (strain Lens) TaxID=297245 RepID=Q5WRW3_LEGPL|nr:hypothetical protein plpl0045 [Legionella pneumophila str. Lens]